MIRSRFELKALSFCALVLGLMALGAGGAQAEPGATWRVNGAAIPGGADLLPQLTNKEIENKIGSLLFVTNGGTHVLILCAELHFSITFGGNGAILLERFTLLGCHISLNEKLATNCQAHSPGKPNGVILSERFKGLITLDVGNDLVKLTPENSKGETSKLLAVIELGELCAIGEEINVETTALGEGLWIRDVGGNAGFLAETTTHLFQEGLSKLLALGQPAKLIGSGVAELGGIHAGLKWSGVPA